MRLWSLHPRLLDAKGLVACWRESLLAQKALAGRTRGYTRHPQLQRFLAQPEPLASIGCYLSGVLDEAVARGYRFDASKINYPCPHAGACPHVAVTEGQIDFERGHLLRKLQARDPRRAEQLQDMPLPPLHPLFTAVPGAVEGWEKDAQAGNE